MSLPVCAHSGLPLSRDERLGPEFGVSPEGVVYYLAARSVDYGPDYFLQEYQQQYGRTYVEDQKNLRALSRRRLDLLARHLPPPASILEIGCAAGFFLDEARARGYEVRGLEVSGFAQKYARHELNLNVTEGSFPKDAPDQTFDCVAAFYVLEHFPDQKRALASIANLLKPGGVFLFALPSTNGPLFATDPQQWARTHPTDHFADYSPAALRKILPFYQLELLEARPGAFHPDRMRRRPYWKWFPGLYRSFATKRAFGDTMEGIAGYRKA